MTITLDELVKYTIFFVTGLGGIILAFYKILLPIIQEKRSRNRNRSYEGEERRSGQQANTLLIDKETIARVIDLWERQIKVQEAQNALMEKHQEIEMDSNHTLKHIERMVVDFKAEHA